ncbi:MAG: T9SS type A sorting domain-containing protein [Bacteroidales bacterium]|nr:T9SS type A sorting domain-containing protein [Bacteroidales bacterium]
MYDARGAAAAACLRDSLFLGLETSGHTAPVFFDLDNDGLTDLLVGCKQQIWTNAAGRRYTKSSLMYYRHAGRVDSSAGHPFVKMTDSLGGVDVIDRSFSNYGYAKPAFYRPASVGAASAEAYLVCGGENGCLKAYAFDGRRWQDTFACAGYLPWWTVGGAVPAWSAGTHGAPALADLNADGLPDLAVGNARGGLHLAYGMPYRPSEPGTPPVSNAPSASAVASVGPLADFVPNPAGENITLRVEAEVRYTLTDLSGRPCLAGRLPAGSHALPLADLPAGLYILYLRVLTPTSACRPVQSLKILKR